MTKPVSGRRLTAAELDRLVAEISERIDAAALASDQWDHVLAALQAIVPGPRAIMLATDDALPNPLVAAASGYLESDLRSFEAYYGGINPWNAVWPRNTAIPVFSDDVLPTRILHASEFYNEWLRRIGEIDHATGIKLFDSNQRRALLSMNHGGARPAEVHTILAPVLRRLGPRMQGALLANRTLALSQRVGPDRSLLDALMEPAFLLDETCRLLAANAAAEALIQDADLLRVGARDAFTLSSAADQARLAKAVRSLCWSGTRANAAEFTLVGRSGAWISALLPVSANSASLAVKGVVRLFTPRALALMVLRATDRSASLASERISALPHLTPSERRLAQALLEGGSLAAIADRLGIAYETARSQLKGVFTKTGVHSQRELLALLLRDERS